MQQRHTASSIYGKRRTAAQLEDPQFSEQLTQYRSSGGPKPSSGAQQRAALQQASVSSAALGQRATGSSREALRGGRVDGTGSFGAFGRRPAAPAAAAAAAPAAPAASANRPYPKENRYELYYSRSFDSSRQRARQILVGLEEYFMDSFIMQHVRAIDFDNPDMIGPIHDVILRSQRYMAAIKSDCILVDRFNSSIIMPEHDIFKVLRNYCQSLVPQQTSAAPEIANDPQRQHALEQRRAQQHEQHRQRQQQQYEQQQQQHRSPPGYGQYQQAPSSQQPPPTAASAYDVSQQPPRSLLSTSMIVKQVGADIESPKANVDLNIRVPARGNSMITAETQEEMAKIPKSDVAGIYGKKKSVTLGYGDNTDLIEKNFMEAHNAANPETRKMSFPQQRSRAGGFASAEHDEQSGNIQRDFQTQQRQRVSQPHTSMAPPSWASGQQQQPQHPQQPQSQFQPQHLQGLAPNDGLLSAGVARPIAQRAPAPGSAGGGMRHAPSEQMGGSEQLGTIKQISCGRKNK